MSIETTSNTLLLMSQALKFEEAVRDVAALHSVFEILDCDERGFAFIAYIVCRECCTFDGYSIEECADNHVHSLDPDDRCATIRIVNAALPPGGEV